MMRASTLGLGLLLSVMSLLAAPVSAQGEGAAAQSAAEDRFAPTEQALEAAQTEPDGIRATFETDARVIAVGLSQGRTDRLVQFLRSQEVIGEDNEWIAGDAHLVYLGNLLGYGPKNLEGLELLKKLADEAADAGGKVHFLIGSTDIYALRGVFSTMTPATYEHMATEESEERLSARLDRWLEELWEYNSNFPDERRQKLRENFARFYKKANRPGSMEFLDLYAEGTELGDWLRSSNTVIRINDVIYASGGLHPIYGEIPLERINAYYRNKVNKNSVFVPAMLDLQAGPAEWMGLSDPRLQEVTLEDINDVLAAREARLLVVGHSPSRFGETMLRGRVVHVDGGFLSPNDQTGYNGVVIEGDRFQIINTGRERKLRVPAVPEASGDRQ